MKFEYRFEKFFNLKQNKAKLESEFVMPGVLRNKVVWKKQLSLENG